MLSSCFNLEVTQIFQIVVAGNTFFYIAFFFCIGRRKSITSYLPCRSRQDLRHGWTVYTNSLLATLNARQMIRNDLGKNSTWDKAKLSLSQFFKSGSMASRVELTHFDIPEIFGLTAISAASTKHFYQHNHHRGVRDRLDQ